MRWAQALTPARTRAARPRVVVAAVAVGVLPQVLVLLGAEAVLLRLTGTTVRHQGAHLLLAALLVLVALVAVGRRRGRRPRLPVLAVLAGHLLTLMPVFALTGGTGGAHPSALAVTDAVSGYLSGPELGWYSACVAVLAAVILLRPSAPTSPVERDGW